MNARILIAAAMVCLFGTACADAPAITFNEYQGGTRLKPRVFFGDDGSKGIVGWRDGKLDFDCDFERAAGGMLCLKAGGWGTTDYYQDADCTVPVATQGTTEMPVALDVKRRGVWKALDTQVDSCFRYVGTGCEKVPECSTGSRPLYMTQDVTDYFAYAAEITGQ